MHASCVDSSFVGVEKRLCRWLEDGGHASWSFAGERPARDVMRVEQHGKRACCPLDRWSVTWEGQNMQD